MDAGGLRFMRSAAKSIISAVAITPQRSPSTMPPPLPIPSAAVKALQAILAPMSCNELDDLFFIAAAAKPEAIVRLAAAVLTAPATWKPPD